jgi:hypothetical protein
MYALTLIEMDGSGLVHMTKYDKFDDLGLMYDMFKRVDYAFVLLKQHIKQYIIDEGNKLVKDDKLKNEEFV